MSLSLPRIFNRKKAIIALLLLASAISISYVSFLKRKHLIEGLGAAVALGKSFAIEEAPLVEPKPKGGRIFCMILTQPDYFFTRAVYIRQAWAHQCDNHKFVTVIPRKYVAFNQSLVEKLDRKETVEFDSTMLHLYQPAKLERESNYGLTDKVYLTLIDVAKNYGDYDWYLKADDDTMIFVDNLRDFLATKSPTAKETYGFNYKFYNEGGFHAGTAGYVLPRGAVHDLAKRLQKDLSACGSTGKEDQDMGRCLNKLGYNRGSSLDDKKRERFHPARLADHYKGSFPHLALIEPENEFKSGSECCSDSTISFSMNPEELMIMSDLLKHSSKRLTFEDMKKALNSTLQEEENKTLTEKVLNFFGIL